MNLTYITSQVTNYFVHMKKIKSALISVFYKDGLEEIIRQLHGLSITIYSTGGTQQFIEGLNIPCVPVESLTGYPSILGGRVKTLHPSVFGGILAKRDDEIHLKEIKDHHIPEIDLVIVDLYPFEETVNSMENIQISDEEKERLIIEKIDIGGPSMIRGAAKNYRDVLVVAAKKDYYLIEEILKIQNGESSNEQRRSFAIKAFDVCTAYDIAISNYFHKASFVTVFNKEENILRYGENPHQSATYFGNLKEVFTQVHGKELSYNNLVDVDSAMQLIKEFDRDIYRNEFVFAIIKHTNVCGIAIKNTLKTAWDSAFGGILICNGLLDITTATAINELFFEVLIAPSFEEEALAILKSKKNRILLISKNKSFIQQEHRSLLNGILTQQKDTGHSIEWKEVGGRETNENEKSELQFANIICKHLKSNAIALIKNNSLVGKGCGQTSRIDALEQAIEKAIHFNVDLSSAVLASDAFFPFDDCIKIAHHAGITAFIQPGGSIRDGDSIEYCKKENLAMVFTGMRHFKH